jgi:hypothetical protein
MQHPYRIAAIGYLCSPIQQVISYIQPDPETNQSGKTENTSTWRFAPYLHSVGLEHRTACLCELFVYHSHTSICGGKNWTTLDILRVVVLIAGYYCDVLPVNTSNNLWVADFLSRFIGYYIRRSLQSLITFPITSHKPVSSSDMNYSWGTSVTNCSWWTHIPDCPGRLLWPDFYSLGDPLLVCSLPRYMRAYRPLLSCNNYPIVSVAHATLPTEQLGALQLYPRIHNSVCCLAMGISIRPSRQHVTLCSECDAVQSGRLILIFSRLVLHLLWNVCTYLLSLHSFILQKTVVRWQCPCAQALNTRDVFGIWSD